MINIGTVILWLKSIQNIYNHPWGSADINIFHQKLAIFLIIGSKDKNCILINNCDSSDSSRVLITTLAPRALFSELKEAYDVIISVHVFANKILSCYSSYIVDMIMWSKFGISGIFIREVIILFYKGLTRKTFRWGVLLVQVQ